MVEDWLEWFFNRYVMIGDKWIIPYLNGACDAASLCEDEDTLDLLECWFEAAIEVTQREAQMTNAGGWGRINE